MIKEYGDVTTLSCDECDRTDTFECVGGAAWAEAEKAGWETTGVLGGIESLICPDCVDDRDSYDEFKAEK